MGGVEGIGRLECIGIGGGRGLLVGGGLLKGRWKWRVVYAGLERFRAVIGKGTVSEL